VEKLSEVACRSAEITHTHELGKEGATIKVAMDKETE